MMARYSEVSSEEREGVGMKITRQVHNGADIKIMSFMSASGMHHTATACEAGTHRLIAMRESSVSLSRAAAAARKAVDTYMGGGSVRVR